MSDLLQWLSSSHTLTTSGWFWVAIVAAASATGVRILSDFFSWLAKRGGLLVEAQR